jgi:hypothetical protein
MEPSFFAHVRIFVVRCHAEHYDAPVVMVVEDLVEFFDGLDGDDFVGFEGLWCLGIVMTVRFGQGEGARY